MADQKRLTLEQLPTPCYVIQEAQLLRNLQILRGVMERTGCHILLAQKAFSALAVYPLIGQYLSGTTASGLYEARLGAEEMGGEVHIFSPAYRYPRKNRNRFHMKEGVWNHWIPYAFLALERIFFAIDS